MVATQYMRPLQAGPAPAIQTPGPSPALGTLKSLERSWTELAQPKLYMFVLDCFVMSLLSS